MSTSLTVRDPQQLAAWTDRISECEKSGKTVTAWCAENGIRLKNYYYWHSKVVRMAGEYNDAAQNRFCDITGSVDCIAENKAATVHIGTGTADIYNGADGNTIIAVIRALQLC